MSQQSFAQFLVWEKTTRDVIDFKKAYVDMSGDLIAGLLLSQIVYWHLPDRQGNANKLRVRKRGVEWIAKQRGEWWEEIRITPKQFDRASKILVDAGLIEKARFRFNGLRTVHVRILQDRFMELWEATLQNPPGNPHTVRVNSVLPKGKDRNSPRGKTQVAQRGRSLTETTTQNTTETTTTPAAVENLKTLLSLGCAENDKVNQVANLEGLTPDIILGVYERGRQNKRIKNLCGWLISELESGRWQVAQGHYSESELAAARAEALSEEPIDVDEYLA